MKIDVVRDFDTQRRFAKEVTERYSKCSKENYSKLLNGTLTDFDTQLESMYLKLMIESARELMS